MFLKLQKRKSYWKICFILAAIALAVALSLIVWSFVLTVSVEAVCTS